MFTAVSTSLYDPLLFRSPMYAYINISQVTDFYFLGSSSYIVAVFTIIPNDLMALVKFQQLSVQLGDDITKNASFIFLNYALLILEQQRSGSSRGVYFTTGFEYESVLFSKPVGYFLLQLIYYNQMRSRLSKSIIYQVTQSKIINPYTHEPIPSRPYLTQPELFNRVSECSRDFRKWRRVELRERKSLVKNLVESIIKDKQVLKPLISDFTGKSYKNIQQQFRRINVVTPKLIEDCEIALRETKRKTQFMGRTYTTKVAYDPVGLTIIFPYYSQPIFDSLIHLIPCLISGNGALLKVSDFNHFMGEYMNKKCKQILGYNNLINDAFIDPTQLPVLREFRPIKKLNFAGTRSSARRIFEVMAEKRFIDCNLFYGAQQAAYVDQTADLEHAADEIVKNAFYNNGQSYQCIRRLYSHKNISAALNQMIADRIEKLKLGNPKLPDTDLGPVTIQQSVLRFEEIINDAINMDAKCIIGGIVHTDGVTKGLFCQPTLLVNCDPNMQAIQEQLNAPLLCVSEVDGFDTFKTEVEDNKYGTGLRIFTKEPTSYRNLVSQLQIGIISFNSGSIIDCDLPIQGWKGSGKGKILSELSYQEFVVPKSFIIDQTL